MKNAHVKDKGTARLFQSRFLESLTRTHVAIPVSIFFLYAVGLLYWSFAVMEISGLLIGFLFLLGLIVFSWVEYQVHRHIFHIYPLNKKRKKLQYTIHGVHHEYPKDKKRLAMPPVMSVAIATLLLLLLKLILGAFSFSFLAGFLCGYAAYLLVHYVVHVFPPPKNTFRKLWIHHGIHHYKHSDKAFGVSSPLWDHIYKTMP